MAPQEEYMNINHQGGEGEDLDDPAMNYSLPIILWIIQKLTILFHISVTTFIVAVFAAKGHLGCLGPAYIAILVLFSTTFIVLITELVLVIRQTLDPLLYFRLQFFKLFIFASALLSMSIFRAFWIDHTASAPLMKDLVMIILILTLLAMVPFLISLIFSWDLWKQEFSQLAALAEEERAFGNHARRPLLYRYFDDDTATA